jgi:hypothetical protein
VNCAHEIRDIANPDFPRSKGEITEEIAVGIKNSREELKESLTLRAVWEKVLVGAAAAESGLCWKEEVLVMF